MAILATENQRFSNVVKNELWPEHAYCRNVVVINDSAATLKVGTVLGKVTATGKYKVCSPAAADGSQTAAAVLLQDITIAATTDTNILAMTRGPAAVSFWGLVFGAGFTTDPQKATARGQLEAAGIQVLDAV